MVVLFVVVVVSPGRFERARQRHIDYTEQMCKRVNLVDDGLVLSEYQRLYRDGHKFSRWQLTPMLEALGCRQITCKPQTGNSSQEQVFAILLYSHGLPKRFQGPRRSQRDPRHR